MSNSILTAEIERLTAKAAIYGDDTIWQQNEFCEILPNPTPLSMSLLRELASSSGATGMVCQELGIDYSATVPMEDYLETIFGRTFVNRAAEKQLTSCAAGKKGLRKLFASAKLQAAIKTTYRNFAKTVTKLDSFYNSKCKIKQDDASVVELLAHIDTLVKELNQHYRHVVKAGMFAKLSLDELQASAVKECFLELLQTDNLEILSTNRDAMEILEYREKALEAHAGFGAEVEYELACPRYWETSSIPVAPSAISKKPPLMAPLPSRTRQALYHFKVYESLKVIYKTLILRELSLLRSAILAYDKMFELNGGVFYLHFNELFSGNLAEHLGIIRERQQAESIFLPIVVPSSLKPADLSELLTGSVTCTDHVLSGISVLGTDFEGHAFLYRNRQDLNRITPGQIVVARHASPDLVMLFGKVNGIITETGGLLSHLAIVAREQGFPVVLQVRQATTAIQDGDQLRVSRDGKIIRN